MKTTRIFFMAALALTFAACSNDDNEFAPQPQKAEGITITAQLAPKTNGTTTRAVSDKSTYIEAKWAVDEHIAILYTVGSTKYAADARIKTVDGTTGVATIEFAVVAGIPDNTDCTLVYPYAAAKTDKTGVKAYADLLATQDGVLDGDLDVRVGAGKIKATTPGLDVITQPAAQFSIFKFTIQNLSGADKTTTAFKVSDNSGNVITTVTPGLATGTLYVALPSLATGTYWFNATIDSKPYIAKATVGTATTAGNYYRTTVKMATFGDFILDDGKFAPSSSTGTKVAMIAYVGSETGEAAPYKHGLALALSDAGGSGTKYKWKTSNSDAGHTWQSSSSFTSESGLQYNDATHNSDTYPAFKAAIANNSTAKPTTGCSDWFLASGYQWAKMFTAAGGAANLKTNATPYTGLESYYYWSSSECDADNAWDFDSDYGRWYYGDKDYDYLVRSCLAF